LDSSIIQGPFSVAPCETLVSRFAAFSSPYPSSGATTASVNAGAVAAVRCRVAVMSALATAVRPVTGSTASALCEPTASPTKRATSVRSSPGSVSSAEEQTRGVQKCRI
jgi:hypothetical protein